jgi:hypothetical protein
MKFTYTVHDALMMPFGMTADIGGVPTAVTVNGLEVTLVAVDSQNSSMVLRFMGADVQPAKDLFVVNSTISVEATAAA